MLVKPSQLWSNLITLGQTRFKFVLFGMGHYIYPPPASVDPPPASNDPPPLIVPPPPVTVAPPAPAADPSTPAPDSNASTIVYVRSKRKKKT